MTDLIFCCQEGGYTEVVANLMRTARLTFAFSQVFRGRSQAFGALQKYSIGVQGALLFNEQLNVANWLLLVICPFASCIPHSLLVIH